MKILRLLYKKTRNFKNTSDISIFFRKKDKYHKLVRKIKKSSPIWGSHQAIVFPDGFILKGGRDSSRIRLFNLQNDLRGITVLDVGCNIGAISIECKKKCAKRVVGIDKDKNLIECAREIAKIFNLDIEYYVTDITEETEITDESFDYVFCLNVFHHLNEMSKIKLLRILDKITKKKLFFEASVSGDPISNTYLKTEDYISYLRGFTFFKNIVLIGKSDFNRPIIICER